MALNFPDSPSVNDTYTVGSTTWTWDGTVWNSSTGAIIPTYVSSFNGSAGSVEGVSSLNGATGAVYSGWGLPWVKPDTGQYWANFLVGDSTTTLAVTNLRVFWIPWIAPADATIDAMAINVTTAGTSAQARVGIYASDATTGKPTGDPLVESVDFDCTSTGTKEDTTISIQVTRGVQYWLSFHATYSGTQTIVKGVGRNSVSLIFFVDPTVTAPIGCYYFNNVTYASGLPTVGTLYNYGTTQPAIFLRLA